MSTQHLLVGNVDDIRSYTQVEIQNSVRSYAEVMDALDSEEMERSSIHSFFLSFLSLLPGAFLQTYRCP
jgi:hypothetical protein